MIIRHVLSFFISICIVFALCSLAYFLLIAIVLLATLLKGLMILPGLLLAGLAFLHFRQTRQLLQKRRITLATITRLSIDRQGNKSYQVQFNTRHDQTVYIELAASDPTFSGRIRTLFLDLYNLYNVQPTYGTRFPLLYDVNVPEKQPRQISFFTLWLGPLLLFWFSVLLLLFGIALWSA